jgi:TonB-dependent Receptor Plug Domain
MLMNLTPQRKVSRRLLLALTCGLAAMPVARSQTKTPPPAAQPAETKPVPVEKTDGSLKGEEQVVLSPFVVTTTKDSGYYAENTLAGSRLSSNLADLAASISVVTKQQLDDTGSLDINDVFKYEAGTEGSGSYTPVVIDRGTAKDTNAGYSFGNNGAAQTNAQSNRVRGIGVPDASINYYSTNNRIPFDSYNTQSIEISRGPNALLFGLGSPAGIVNQSVMQAALNKDTAQIQFRTDQNGSFRSSLNFNKVLIDDKLAVAGAALYNNQQFERKPSSDLTRRQYGAFTYKPFKNTTIRAFAENYQNNANRPNSLTPRDLVTPWIQNGRPSYDPTTRLITNTDTGQTVGPYVAIATSPGFVTGNVVGASAPTSYFLTTTPPNTVRNSQWQPAIQFEDTARPLRLIDGNGNSLAYFARQPLVAGKDYATVQSNPAQALQTLAQLGWVANDPRYAFYDRQWSSSALNYPSVVVNKLPYASINGVAYGNYQNPGVTNKSIYDWTKYNLVQTNFSTVKAANYNIEIEQQLLPNLFFSAGWFRQDIEEVDNYTMGQLTGNTISVDTNVKRIDGTVNPYYGLAFISEGVGGGMDTFKTPQTDDNFRAQLAYDLDLTKQNNFMSWFGRHRLLGFLSQQNSRRAIERWRNNFVDGDNDAKLRYLQNLTLTNQQMALNSALMRKYYLANPGDPQGTVTQAAGAYNNRGWDGPYGSQVSVYNYGTSQFQNDSVVEQSLFSSAGSFKTQREVKSWTLAAQSYFWDERLITTLGWRHDDYRARITTVGAVTDINGVVTSPSLTNAQLYTNGFTGLINHDLVMNRWGRWDELSGTTKTLGGAFRPFKDWTTVKRMGGEGSLLSELLDGMTFYYNQSDNFNPPLTYQTDYFKRPLAKPTGKGKDFGVGFNLLKNKLVARISWYDTQTKDERTDSASTLLTRLAYSDTTTGLAWASAVQRIRNGANTNISNWNTEGANPVSDPANQQKIYDLIKLPLNYYTGMSPGGTQDSSAKGMELQVTYNPIPNWTIKVTGDKQKTTYNSVAPQYDSWLAERLPVWQSLTAPDIADFTDAGQVNYSLKNFWTGYGFTNVARDNDASGNTSPAGYFANVVASQVALAKALQGVDAPDQRKYHLSLLTNYTFVRGKLKGLSIGGSERWESKAAIGYYGKVNDPVNAPGVINFADATRPVYDSGNYYTDVWIGYSRKIFSDKIGWKLQLNVYNAFEDGRLMPVAVNYDGTPWSYRIIDPRQFVLTTTFSF